MTTFAELGVPARMAEALAAAGMTDAFAVQSITLPDALAGRDLCGRAPTGSGKTLGFGIPLMARVSQATPNRPTGLVLVPTRELAEQVQRAVRAAGPCAVAFRPGRYGGAPMAAQIHSLQEGCVRRGRHRRAVCSTSSSAVTAISAASRCASSTRPTAWPTSASCPTSARSST